MALRSTAEGWLLRVARSSLGRGWVGWIFAHMTFALPFERLYESEQIIAFHHPQPAYAVHILIIPKRAIANLTDLTGIDAILLAEIYILAGRLVRELGLQDAGYRLIVNGGRYQSLPQLHFHLVSGAERGVHSPGDAHA